MDSQTVHPLIDHPHSYRAWNIVAATDTRGFYLLESRFSITSAEADDPPEYSIFSLCLHESEFEP